jgi:outer membrane immunogenic protein
VYATGGGAWTQLQSANYFNPICSPGCAVNQSATFSGWAAGGGIEYAFTQNWIAGAEYLFAEFGRHNFVFNGPTNVNEQINVVRARLSYKFF